MDANTERDTLFLASARLLLQQLMGKYDHLPLGEWGPAEKDERIIARHDYDLVLSVIKLMPHLLQGFATALATEEVMGQIADILAHMSPDE